MVNLTTQTHNTDTDEARWAAVCERNDEVDGVFVYAVKTTGIYCSPGCPSRRAKRENVVFFDAGHHAESAGYRPCKRCRPDGSSIAQRNALVARVACRRLESAVIEPSLDDLALEAGLSRFHFQRVFKSIVGLTPKQYARGARAPRLRETVKTAPSLTDAAFESGHESMRHFYDKALVAFGMTPGTFRAGARGEVIIDEFAKTSLGTATAAFAAGGVCAVRITDDAEAGEQELRDLFPAALLIPGGEDFTRLMRRVVTAIEEPSLAVGLPLDIRGTAFQ